MIESVSKRVENEKKNLQIRLNPSPQNDDF